MTGYMGQSYKKVSSFTLPLQVSIIFNRFLLVGPTPPLFLFASFNLWLLLLLVNKHNDIISVSCSSSAEKWTQTNTTWTYKAECFWLFGVSYVKAHRLLGEKQIWKFELRGRTPNRNIERIIIQQKLQDNLKMNRNPQTTVWKYHFDTMGIKKINVTMLQGYSVFSCIII